MAYRLHFASSCSDSVLAIDLYVIVCISVLYMKQVIMVAIVVCGIKTWFGMSLHMICGPHEEKTTAR